MIKSDSREKIRIALAESPQLNKCFHPLIEEFFLRLEDQYNFHDLEINKRIARVTIMDSIDFAETDKTIDGQFWTAIDNKLPQWESLNQWITFNKNNLKYILLADREKIENFINTAFHEQGHAVQHLVSTGDTYDGLRYSYNGEKWNATIINEFAEIINAQRLQKGNLNTEQYSGYESIQNLSKSIISALGISEEELGNLQMTQNGRTEYEKIVKKNIGDYYKIPLYAIENSLDTISSIADTTQNKLITDKEQKENLYLQFESVNTISNNILKRRFEKLGENPTIEELAKVVYDKKKRDMNFTKAVREYKMYYGLPIRFMPDLQTKMIKEMYGDKLDKEQLKKEIKRLEIKEKYNCENGKKYDNNQLIDDVIQSMRNYDISKYPLKDRIKLNIYKKIGEIKTAITRPKFKNNYMLEEGENPAKNSREEFIERINEGYVLANEKNKNNPNKNLDLNRSALNNNPNSIETGKDIEDDESIR